MPDRSRKGSVRESHDPYQFAHDEVRRLWGPASQHTCPCGQRAQGWALQHQRDVLLGEIALVEKSDGTFARISTSPYDYAALCLACHYDYDRPAASIGFEHPEGWSWSEVTA